MLRRPFLVLAGVATAPGCTEEREIHSILTALDGDAPERVELVAGVGRDEVTIPVRVVNQYGAAVEGTEVGLAVSGECAGSAVQLVDASVAIDESGYGYGHVLAPCTTRFTVEVTDSADKAQVGATIDGYGLANVPPLFQMGGGAALPPEAQNPSLVAAGTGGVAIGSGRDVWWQGDDVEQPPHRVAELPTELTDMVGAHIDDDGVMDLVAWGGSVVFLLRGVDEGGYTWEGGFYVADDREITGVGVQDLDGDRYPDLAVAATDGHDGWVEILFGNGAWEWHTTDVLETTFPVTGVTATDEDKDGWADVTVLDGNIGYVRRWTQAEPGWLEGAPPTLIDPTQVGYYDAPEGSRLLPMVDLDHDDRLDIVVNEAPGAGNQQLVFFVMGQSGVTFYHEPYTAYFAALADMNQDGAEDLLSLEDYVLHIIRHDLPTGEFTSQGVVGVGLAAPLVAAFVDGDDVHDVVIVKDTVALYTGELVPDDKTGQLLWEAIAWNWTSFQTGFTGPHLVTETTGDGLADVVGFTENSSADTILRSWSITADGTGVPAVTVVGASIGFDSSTDLIPYDLVRCGADFFALAGDGASTAELMRFTAGGGGLTRVSTRAASGTLLACGPTGAAVVVGSENGAWTSYALDLAELDSGDVGEAGAIAVADVDGNDEDEVVSCSPAPCTIAVTDVDQDGFEEIIRGSDTGLTIEGWGATTDLAGVGDVSTWDVDRDGYDDILATDGLSGQILLFRGVPGGLAPAVAYHTDEGLFGKGAAFDTSGDGVPEFLVEGDGGTLSISAPSIPAPQ